MIFCKDVAGTNSPFQIDTDPQLRYAIQRARLPPAHIVANRWQQMIWFRGCRWCRKTSLSDLVRKALVCAMNAPTAKLSLTQCNISSAFTLAVPYAIHQVPPTADEVGIKTIDARTLGGQHTVILIPDVPIVIGSPSSER